jgi:hypothetical protein
MRPTLAIASVTLTLVVASLAAALPDYWLSSGSGKPDYVAIPGTGGPVTGNMFKNYTSSMAGRTGGGLRGYDGLDGATGPQGPQGVQGEPGTNASVTDQSVHDASEVQGRLYWGGQPSVEQGPEYVEYLVKYPNGSIAATVAPSRTQWFTNPGVLVREVVNTGIVRDFDPVSGAIQKLYSSQTTYRYVNGVLRDKTDNAGGRVVYNASGTVKFEQYTGTRQGALVL